MGESSDQEPKAQESINLAVHLTTLGNAVKTWDGKDLDALAKPSKDVLISCTAKFKENKDADYLLCHLLVQTMISTMLSRNLFATMLNMQSKIPKKVTVRLGDEIIGIGESVDKADFEKRLLKTLAFVYSKDLIPIMGSF